MQPTSLLTSRRKAIHTKNIISILKYFYSALLALLCSYTHLSQIGGLRLLSTFCANLHPSRNVTVQCALPPNFHGKPRVGIVRGGQQHTAISSRAKVQEPRGQENFWFATKYGVHIFPSIAQSSLRSGCLPPCPPVPSDQRPKNSDEIVYSAPRPRFLRGNQEAPACSSKLDWNSLATIGLNLESNLTPVWKWGTAVNCRG